MDTRRWGPGERIVFEPYTKEVFEESLRWIADRGIFPEGGMGTGDYALVDRDARSGGVTRSRFMPRLDLVIPSPVKPLRVLTPSPACGRGLG